MSKTTKLSLVLEHTTIQVEDLLEHTAGERVGFALLALPLDHRDEPEYVTNIQADAFLDLLRDTLKSVERDFELKSSSHGTQTPQT